MKNTCYRLRINGKVQGVGFRIWFQKICNARDVVGFVKNSTESRTIVEALICGTEPKIDEVLQLSHKGPRLAVVKCVEKEQGDPTEAEKFNRLDIH